jgi:Pyruvate/2-oxoacid:ferredoxin oxidoreductase gamma subunit
MFENRARIKIETLKETIMANVPKRTIELNLKAFDLGLQQGIDV